MTPEAWARAILLVAHGSRSPEANAEIAGLVAPVAASLPVGGVVRHAFLELAGPSVPEAIDALVDGGARCIVLIPYFLAQGKHVTRDIHNIVQVAQQIHLGLEIRTTSHFGTHEQIPRLLAAMVPNQGVSHGRPS